LSDDDDPDIFWCNLKRSKNMIGVRHNLLGSHALGKPASDRVNLVLDVLADA
jgi:hypothetical protein